MVGENRMTRVFILHHVHRIDEDNEDVKLIGIYSNHSNAENAKDRLSLQAGFKDNIEGFEINEYILDKDNWTEGFSTISPSEFE